MSGDPGPPAEPPRDPGAPPGGELSLPLPSDPHPDTLVYVDPDHRSIVGALEWTRSGRPKSKPYLLESGKSRRRFYPWGTFRGMCGAFRLTAKREEQSTKSLDDVIPKILDELWL